MSKTISDPADSVQLKNDIKSLSYWSEQWSLLFNPTKIVKISFESTHPTSYTIGTSSITKVESYKDLGFILKSNLGIWVPTMIKSLLKPTAFWVAKKDLLTSDPH